MKNNMYHVIYELYLYGLFFSCYYYLFQPTFILVKCKIKYFNLPAIIMKL